MNLLKKNEKKKWEKSIKKDYSFFGFKKSDFLLKKPGKVEWRLLIEIEKLSKTNSDYYRSVFFGDTTKLPLVLDWYFGFL